MWVVYLKMPTLTKKRFCVTRFRGHGELSDDLFNNENIARAVWQTERCPNTQRVHIQAYVETKTAMTFNQFQSRVFKANLRESLGSPWQNYEYCTKQESQLLSEGDVLYPKGQIGEFQEPRRHRRSRLPELVEDAKEGKSLYEIMDKYGPEFLRHCNGIATMVDMYRQRERPKSRGVRVVCLYGPTGVGKSYLAREILNHFHGDNWAVPTPPGEKGRHWLGCMVGRKGMLIEEMDSGMFSYRTFLQWTDVWTHQTEVRNLRGGGFADWETVVITTNVHPRHWFPSHQYGPIGRRLSHLLEWNTNTNPEGAQWMSDLADWKAFPLRLP